MDLILDQDKPSNMNIVNNNPVKGVKEMSSAADSPVRESNNNVTDMSPISVSPTVSETIYEFGTHFENPSHVVSEKVFVCVLHSRCAPDLPLRL